MIKSNKIKMLMLSGILGLGFMGNSVYAAAARTPEQIIIGLLNAVNTGNRDEAAAIMREFTTISNQPQYLELIKHFDWYIIVADLNKNFDTLNTVLEMLLTFQNESLSAEDKQMLPKRCLFIAIAENSIDKVKLLLNQGVNVDSTLFSCPFYKDNWSALITAIHYGHEEIAQLLIERGANIHHKGYNDGRINTPLERAVYKKLTTLINILIQAGADVNCVIVNDSYFQDNDCGKNREPKTLLELIQQCIDYPVAMRLLIDAGVPVTRDTITFACKNGFFKDIEILTEGLLKNQMRLQAQKCNGRLGACDQNRNGCLRVYDVGIGHTGQACGDFERLSGEPLNIILGHIGAQECAALRRTCHGMTQLQPDISELRIWLRQMTAKEFLQTKNQYFARYVYLNPIISFFLQELTEFMQEEARRPVCDINQWETLIRKNKIVKLREMKPMREECTKEIEALESLIQIVQAYYQMSIDMIQTGTMAPPAIIVGANITPCTNIERQAMVAVACPSLKTDDAALTQPSSSDQSICLLDDSDYYLKPSCLLFDEGNNDAERPLAPIEARRVQIEADRAIMAQQDREYQASLTADRIKEQHKKEIELQDNCAGRAPMVAAVTFGGQRATVACDSAAAVCDGVAATISEEQATTSIDQNDDREPTRTRQQMREVMASARETQRERPQ